MSPSPLRNSKSSFSVGGFSGSAGTTIAHARSPDRGSGRPITAASATCGLVNSRSSTSLAEMFSPLRMMTSFSRPVIAMNPSASRLPRSPVRK